MFEEIYLIALSDTSSARRLGESKVTVRFIFYDIVKEIDSDHYLLPDKSIVIVVYLHL